MATRVAVLGAGYAGVTAAQQLEDELADLDATLTWISEEDHHFVLHESHRLIRRPERRDLLTVPVSEIASSETTFLEREVDEVEPDEREIRCADGSTVDYDYVLDCLGSQTAFHGIDGLESHALTLKSLDDAIDINEAVVAAARDATSEDPAQVVVGGAGLTGIQSAGEIAAWRDVHDGHIEISLVEAMGQIFPGHSHEFQGALRDRLESRDVEIHTDAAFASVDDSSVHFEERDDIDYDVLLWAGGVTGLHEIEEPEVEVEDDRIEVDATLQSDDERVFAAGDSALVEQEDDETPPPTAQAAWGGAEVAAKNVARAIQGRSLERWDYEDKGTLVSVGDDAVAHGVVNVPVSTFDGTAARTLKKAISARWIARVSSWQRAARAWPIL